MAKSGSKNQQILAIVLIVLGIGLAFWGYQQSGSVGSQLNQALNGAPADNVMMYYIGGAISIAVGAFLLFR